jgi:hypothetical protein
VEIKLRQLRKVLAKLVPPKNAKQGEHELESCRNSPKRDSFLRQAT